MSRPHKCRLIGQQPSICRFKPAGVPGRQLDTIELALDELEALRLADFEGLYHEAAADRMGISRPTFGRVLERARHKVAVALCESKILVIQGGAVMTASERAFECAACTGRFEVPFGTGWPGECPHCKSSQIQRVDAGREPHRGGDGRRCRRRRGWAQRSREVTDGVVQETKR